MAGIVLQTATLVADSVAADQTLAFTNAFTTGNAVVVTAAVQHYLGGASGLINGITDNKGGTYVKRTARCRTPASPVTDLYAEIWDRLGATDASPATRLQITVDLVRTEANHNVYLQMHEVSGLTAFSVAGSQTGGEANSSSATATTGVLPSQPQVGFAVCAHFSTNTAQPAGWTSLGASNAAAAPGYSACWRDITATTALSEAFTYAASLYGAAVVLATYTTTTVNKRIVINLDSTKFDSLDTGITVLVWRGNPVSVQALQFNGQAGSATAGKLYITGTSTTGFKVADMTVGEALNVVAYNSTDGSTLLSATVETF